MKKLKFKDARWWHSVTYPAGSRVWFEVLYVDSRVRWRMREKRDPRGVLSFLPSFVSDHCGHRCCPWPPGKTREEVETKVWGSAPHPPQLCCGRRKEEDGREIKRIERNMKVVLNFQVRDLLWNRLIPQPGTTLVSLTEQWWLKRMTCQKNESLYWFQGHLDKNIVSFLLINVHIFFSSPIVPDLRVLRDNTQPYFIYQ